MRGYAVDPMALADSLGIPRDEVASLLESSDHSYDCRCNECREWWRQMGPDPDTGEHGPFTAEEVRGD